MYQATYLYTKEEIIKWFNYGKTIYFAPHSKELWKQNEFDPDHYTGSVWISDNQIKVNLQYGYPRLDTIEKVYPLNQKDWILERIWMNHPTFYAYLYDYDLKNN